MFTGHFKKLSVHCYNIVYTEAAGQLLVLIHIRILIVLNGGSLCIQLVVYFAQQFSKNTVICAKFYLCNVATIQPKMLVWN